MDVALAPLAVDRALHESGTVCIALSCRSGYLHWFYLLLFLPLLLPPIQRTRGAVYVLDRIRVLSLVLPVDARACSGAYPSIVTPGATE